MALKKYKTFIFLLLAFLWVWWRFPDFFQHPNTYVIEPWGDGYKAYTVVQYHAQYDSTYHWFEGMNYPYGDHAVQGATQPIISNTIKFISRHFVDIAPYTIGIMNSLLLLGYILSGLFIFLLLQRLKLPFWYALPVAMGILLLSPQTERFQGHYGLAHMEVIPVLLFLWHWNYEKLKWDKSMVTGFVIIAFSMIHFYFAGILFASTLAWHFFDWIISDRGKKAWQRLGHLSIQLGIPFFFYYLFIFRLDTVADRTKVPWGFEYFHAQLQAIIYAPHLPFFKYLEGLGAHFIGFNIEQKSYIGIVALLGVLFLLIRFIFKKFQSFITSPDKANNRFLGTLFITSLIVLFFSFGWPFTIKGGAFLLDYFSFIRQFRSVGRFAWVFYYSINVIVFYQLFYLFKKKYWLVLPIAILLIEGYQHSTSFDLRLDPILELPEGKRFTDLKEIKWEDYQALLPIPYYTIGSDNFWWHPKGLSCLHTNTISIQTGLPVIAAQLTRTSVSQSFYQLQLVTEPYRMPKVFKDYKNEKDILMIWDKYDVARSKHNYNHLLIHADSLFSKGDVVFYKLPLSSWKMNLDSTIQKVKAEVNTLDSLWLHEYFSPQSEQPFHVNNWNKNKAEGYIGGGLSVPTNERYILCEKDIQSDTVIASFWMKMIKDLHPKTEVYFWAVSSNGEQQLLLQKQSRELIRLVDPNGWALLEEEIILPKDRYLKIELDNEFKVIKGDSLMIDELMIRAKGADIYGKTEAYIMKNNAYFKLQ